jgi:hypothetical protein
MSTTTITKIILRRGTQTQGTDVTLSQAEPAWVSRTDGHHDLYIGDGTNKPGVKVASSEAFYGELRTSDPEKPAEGKFVIWMSNGSTLLDTSLVTAGDVIIAATNGGITRYHKLFDHGTPTYTWS